jgi:TonB-linked SusC/RagA family outer membrane protein
MKTKANLIARFLLSSVLAVMTAAGVWAQSNVVSGVVTDAKTQEPAVGAAVMVKGTTRGMIVDNNGHYSLNASEGETLVCQLFGYKTVEITVGKSAVINFSLEEDTQTLEQSVVVGYGTLKKKQLVGAVEELSGEELEDRTAPSVNRMLQGQVAGLNISFTDGKPSHYGSIYVRGGSQQYYSRSSGTSAAGTSHSIGNGTGALVLIDGVEGSLNQVNPDDIASISVLKDAASAAVYGARGAFGVILVTTKDPQKDKFSINYSGSYSINRRTVIWEDEIEYDSYNWATAFEEFWDGDARTPSAAGKWHTDVNNIDVGLTPEYLEELAKRKEAGYPNQVETASDGSYVYYGHTNWMKLFYKPYNHSQTHSISINAASKKIRYSLSGRYYNQDGIYKVGDEDYRTYNMRSKGAIDIKDWLTVDNNTSFYYDKYDQPFFAYNMPFLRNLEHRGQPIFVPTNPDGTHTYWGEQTGYWRFKEGDDTDKRSSINFQTTFGVTFTPIKDVLKIRADYTFKARRYKWDRVRTASQYSMVEGVLTDLFVEDKNTYHSRQMNNTDYQAANIVATYTPKLGENHDLNIVAGWNLTDNEYTNYYMQRKGVLWDEYPSFELMDGTEYAEPNDYKNSSGLVGFFARVNYTLMQRYIFEVAARYDGSSKFPSDSRWGFFPSASVGWRINEEPWMKWADSWLNNLKIRANVGSLGNSNISDYYFMEKMSISKSSVLYDGEKSVYTKQASVVPDDLTWETVTTYDVGLDWDILNSRLSFSGDWYLRKNDDMIINGPTIPAIYGASSPRGNYGSMETRGWELTLAWKDQFDLKGKPFRYSIKGSLWDSTSKITDYYNASGYIYNFYEGKKLGEIWGFRTDGYFLSNAEAAEWTPDSFHKNGSNFQAYAGDLKFIDVNGDGKISNGSCTLDDHGDLERIGNTTPHYQYGINLDASWNGISLSLFFQGVGQRDWYPVTESGFFWGMYNRPYGFLLKEQEGDNYVHVDYSTSNWTVTNADKHPYWTRRVAYSANRNVGPLTYENDYYLQDASYLRLKNVTLSYTLPSKLTKKIDIQQVRIYFSGDNLLTFSPIYKHTKMYDPEGIASGDSDFSSSSTVPGLGGVGEGYSYPMLKTFTFGVNLTF